MSKRINNYNGRHKGYKQKKAVKVEKERKGIPPVTMMFINYAAKITKFVGSREVLRQKLMAKGKQALTGEKRQKVLNKFFAVKY